MDECKCESCRAIRERDIQHAINVSCKAIFDATARLDKQQTNEVVDGKISWLTGVKRLGNFNG